MDSCVKILGSEIPCREHQAETLLRLMGYPDHGACQSIFIYGHASTGKTFLVTRLMKELQVKYAYVNAIETYSTRILFETILNQLTETVPSMENEFSNYANCDNMCDFLRHLKTAVSEDFSSSSAAYIVIDNAERLRDLDPVVLATFLRMQELAKRQICVILISEIVWEKFQCGTGYCDPHLVHFPQYSQEEVIRILGTYRPEEYTEEFYTKYLHLLLSVFSNITRNLRELQYAAQLNFPRFCAPVKEGSATEKDIHKLWRSVEPYMKKSLHSVYLREISSCQYEKMHPEEQTTGEVSWRSTVVASRKRTVELPFYSKFLLLAAYMASYNPPSTDRRYFVKNQGKGKKRRNCSQKEKPNNHLLGPKQFPLNRMLAIFYAIVDERVAPSAMIFSQIKSLVTLRLLAQLTKDDQLSEPKYKCLVSLDFIRTIARTVNFDVIGHLHDFNM